MHQNKTEVKVKAPAGREVQHHDPEKEKGPLQIQTKQKTEQVLMSNQKTNTSRKEKRRKVQEAIKQPYNKTQITRHSKSKRGNSNWQSRTTSRSSATTTTTTTNDSPS